jgi:uncharacterized damage-inducible protein DinB
MKKYVFTVKDDVCLANEKDVNAVRVLEVMKTYGSVEDYDAHIAAVKNEYQEALDNVVAQNEAIKQQNLTDEEIALVNEYRKQRAKAVQTYIDENARLNQTLETVKAEHEKTIAIIANVINKK